MRPHRLQLHAFGAFPAEASLDLDALGEQGLVLLTGDTGSGKTTLLDALGFALYGSVVGERSKAKDLRSHHAEPGAEPWVELEFTARGRRMRVRRSPAWSRPGRATDVPSKGTLSELRDGSWEPVSTRLDEIGLELSSLLGMSAEQFHSVVVLPQGRFATFLQASSAEREALLKKLFLVERFEFVQEWLATRSRAAAEDLARASAVADGIAARVAQVEGSELPEDVPPDVWATDLLAAATATVHRLGTTVTTAGKARASATTELAEARDLRRRQQARGELETQLAGLMRDEPHQQLRRSAVGVAERARPVLLAQAAQRQALDELTAALGACRGCEPALAALGIDLGPLTSDGAASPDAEEAVLATLDAAQQRRGRLTALAEVATAGATARAAAVTAQQRVTAAETRLGTADIRAGQLPGEIERLQERVASARSAAAELPRLRLVADAQQLASTRRASRAVELARADAHAIALADARADLELLEAQLQEVRVRRIDAAATELAAYLEDGTPCPVCGALEHPEPAEVRTDDVTRDQERELAGRLETARSGRDRLVGELATARARVDGLTELLADAPDGQDVSAQLEALAAAAADLAHRESELTALRAQETALLVAMATDRAELASAAAAAEDAQADALAAERRVLAETGGLTLPAALREVETVLEVAGATGRALLVLGEARRSHDRAVSALDGVAREQGFLGASEAAEGALPDAELASLRASVADFDAALSAVRARLAEPDLAVSLDLPVDVEAALEDFERARKAEAAAIAEAAIARDRLDQLAALVPQLAAATAGLDALRATSTQLRELAEVAAGRGANRLRMPLASFVLAARLEEVAEAASLRLERMTGGRYTLVHSDVGRDGRGRAGLALQVEDAWTARRRDTATLSGGETFQAALALALGLADVVTAETGGATIDALFVDEGFGSLDPDSLDAVMDVLDSLRSGGRLVGVVSHVAEMRQRIPAQIRVAKGTTGSSVSTTC